MHTLEIKNVCKTSRGKQLLKNINAVFEGGNVYGITGKNGAGKTVFFKTITGLMTPTSGCVLYDGCDIKETKSDIGLLTDDISFYPEFTGMKNLLMLAGIRRRVGNAEVGQAMKRVGLNPDDKTLFWKYSLGMKQRLSLAQAVMEHPAFLFLDEPTNSIDETGVDLFYKIVREEADRGAVVLISSHIKSDINELTDEVYLMQDNTLTKRGE